MPPADQQTLQQLLQGINTMQMQAGLMPGGLPASPMQNNTSQMQRPPTAMDMSRNIQVSFQQQQQLSQLVTPPPPMGSFSPVGRPGPMSFNAPSLPGAQFGNPRALAQQQHTASTNALFAGAQSGMGVAGRVGGGVGAAALGTLVGGPLGGIAAGMAFEHFGGGQAAQDTGASLMQPMVNQRQRTLQLQGMSQLNVRRGGDLAASGRGLNTGASMRLERGLMNMADDQGFQKDTGDMFNRQDVMKITRLAGNMGMLEQDQSADEIKRSVGKISRALSNFMKIAEEPDVQQAMQMMGKMKNLGMGITETTSAAQNAKMFARMAGTDVKSVMQAGMQGAGQFQQVGLSGASGMNAGMAAQGAAGMLTSAMSPRLLSMLGGNKGMTQAITRGAANAGISGALLPGMLTMQNGQMQADPSKMMAVMSGEMSIEQLMQNSSNAASQMGPRGMQDMMLRKRELQDQLQQSMGGMGSIMMPLIQAQAIMKQNPQIGGHAALTMALGGDQQAARAFKEMATSDEFWRGLKQQEVREMRDRRGDIAKQRAQVREEAQTPQAMRALGRPFGRAGRSAGGAFDRVMQREFGEENEIEAEVDAQGGGDLIRAVRRQRLDSSTQQAHLRDRMRSSSGRQGVLRDASAALGQMNAGRVAENEMDQAQQTFRRVPGGGLLADLHGPEGFGLTAASRGGQTVRQTVRANEGLLTRMGNMPSLLSGGELGRNTDIRGQEMMAMGTALEGATLQNDQQRIETMRRAQQSGADLGIDNPEKFNAVTAKVAAKLNEKLDSMVYMGVQTGDISNMEMERIYRETLMEEGVDPATAGQLARNADFKALVVQQGEGSRTAAAQTALENQIEAGGAVKKNQRLQSAMALRKNADRQRESALKRVGVDTGLFSDASNAEQKRILDVMGGTGKNAEARRKIMAAKAMGAARDTEGKANMEANLKQMVISGEITAKDYTRLRREVNQSLSDVDPDVLREMGESMAGKSTAEINKAFAAAGAEVNAAQAGAFGEALVNLFGEEGAKTFASDGGAGGVGRLRDMLDQGGDLGDLSSAMKRKIRSGDVTSEELIRLAERQATGDMGVATEGGLTQKVERAFKQGGFMGAAETSIREMFGGEQTRGVADGLGEFGPAVNQFSEASVKMTEAANALLGVAKDGEFAGVVQSGDDSGIALGVKHLFGL